MPGLRVPQQDQLLRHHLDRVVNLHQLLPSDGRVQVYQFPADWVLELREGGMEVGGANCLGRHVMVGAVQGGEMDVQVIQGECGGERDVLEGERGRGKLAI